MLKQNLTSCLLATGRSKLGKTVFLSLALLAFGSATAYAKTDKCPGPGSILFDKASGQWQTIKPGWISSSQARHADSLGRVTLNNVELNIDFAGDTATCTYTAANQEQVVFTKGTSSSGAVSAKSANATPAELMYVNRTDWDNSKNQRVFVCTLSAKNACAFEDLAPPEDQFGLFAANDALSEALDGMDAEFILFNDPATDKCKNIFKLRDSVKPVIIGRDLIKEAADNWFKAIKEAYDRGDNEEAQRLEDKLIEVSPLFINLPLEHSEKMKYEVTLALENAVRNCPAT